MRHFCPVATWTRSEKPDYSPRLIQKKGKKPGRTFQETSLCRKHSPTRRSEPSWATGWNLASDANLYPCPSHWRLVCLAQVQDLVTGETGLEEIPPDLISTTLATVTTVPGPSFARFGVCWIYWICWICSIRHPGLPGMQETECGHGSHRRSVRSSSRGSCRCDGCCVTRLLPESGQQQQHVRLQLARVAWTADAIINKAPHLPFLDLPAFASFLRPSETWQTLTGLAVPGVHREGEDHGVGVPLGSSAVRVCRSLTPRSAGVWDGDNANMTAIGVDRREPGLVARGRTVRP